MAAEAKVDVHDGALPAWALRRGGRRARRLAKFDVEAERWGIEVRGLSREGLAALIEGSAREIPTTEHRTLHQEASDFVRWGRRGAIPEAIQCTR